MFRKIFKKRKWILTAATDVGSTRQVNQDNLYLEEIVLDAEQLSHFVIKKEYDDAVLCAVCDGMGGGTKGEEAAYVTVQMLHELQVKELKNADSKTIEEKLRFFTQTLSNVVYERFKEERVYAGCTMTLLYTDSNKTIIENVGDSPCILIRNGHYEVISVSDNQANLLYQMGKISEEERWTHKTKNQLTQYIGMNPAEILLSPHIYVDDAMQKNDMYLIFSDGLIDKMSMENVVKIAQTMHRNIAEVLVTNAIDCGSRDNVSVIVIKRES